MATSRLRALRWAVLGACSSALVLVTLAGANDGDNFILGVTTNTASSETRLESTATTAALSARDSAFGAIAVFGFASGLTGPNRGVTGTTSSSSGGSYGVYGVLFNNSPNSGTAGVYGHSNSQNSNGPGVWGVHLGGSGTAPGVRGTTVSTAPDSVGVQGIIESTSPGFGSAGVRGENLGTNGNGYGVYGSHDSAGIGVLGTTPSGYGVAGASGVVGVLGYAPTPGFAGYFAGDVHVSGTLTKGAGAFQIDPANKYLQHSFVESPDMKNVYDGVVTTDRRGFATVTLPRYFQALNRDFRYQLTIVGRSFAKAIIWNEIANNRFTIRTDAPTVKVSWQVTGIRKDRYANAHRIQPELAKPAGERGRYLSPELYGEPRSKSLVRVPTALRRAAQP